jgi:hypothetical protein
MPKKARQESQAEQSARFKRDAQKLIDDGTLSPTAAERALEDLVRNQGGQNSGKSPGKTDSPI